MNKNVYLILGIFCFVVFLSIFCFVMLGYETNTRRALCVDGDGDINLEGIMCEKEYTTWYGKEDTIENYLSIPILLIFILGLVFVNKYLGGKEE